jgi:hypothetical protein
MNLQMLIASNKVYLHKCLDELFVKDALTHETVAVYGIRGTQYIAYDKIACPTKGIIWCDPTKSSSVSDLVETNTVPYSEYIVSRILERVTEGAALTSLCKEVGMPSYAQLCRWMRLHPWIRQGLEDARLARAEVFRDRIALESEKAESYKDPIEATKVRIDASKWLAGVDDARYKSNNKIEAVINVPTQIIVQTGISRGEPEEAVHVTDTHKEDTLADSSARDLLRGTDTN